MFFPAGIVVGLLSGGGYTETGDGYANAGVNVGGKAFWLLLVLGLGYCVVCEAATGRRLGGCTLPDADAYLESQL